MCIFMEKKINLDFIKLNWNHGKYNKWNEKNQIGQSFENSGSIKFKMEFHQTYT